MNKTRCRGPNCKTSVIWGEEVESAGTALVTETPEMLRSDSGRLYLPTGKKIPLDPSCPCYHILGEPKGRVIVVRVPHVMVTHFKTCRDVGQFSKGRR